MIVELDGVRRKRTRQPCARFLLSIVTSPANAGCGLRPRKCRTSVAPSAVTAAVTRSPRIASSAARSVNRMSLAYSPWSITHQQPAKPAAVMAGSSGLTSNRLALQDRQPVGGGEPLAQRRDRRGVLDRGDLVVA